MTQDFPALDSNGDLVRNICALELSDVEFSWVASSLIDLTDRELDVVRAICAGGANEEIADRLCVAVPTLRTHMTRINQKLNASGKDDVVRIVASLLLDAYRSGRLGRRADRVVEVKGNKGNSAGASSCDPHSKSSLAMTTGQSVNGQ